MKAEFTDAMGQRWLIGIASVARELSVSLKQADAWRARAERNGFPTGVTITEGGKPRRVWLAEEVVGWHLCWVRVHPKVKGR